MTKWTEQVKENMEEMTAGEKRIYIEWKINENKENWQTAEMLGTEQAPFAVINQELHQLKREIVQEQYQA